MTTLITAAEETRKPLAGQNKPNKLGWRGGGGVLPYCAYTGRCHWVGFVFFGVAVLKRVYNFPLLCPKLGVKTCPKLQGMVTRSVTCSVPRASHAVPLAQSHARVTKSGSASEALL